MIYLWPKLWTDVCDNLAVRGRAVCWPFPEGLHEWIVVTQVWGPIYIEQVRFVDEDCMFSLV